MKQNNKQGKGFHIMAKPMGPVCNLNCEYCFYLEKKALFKHQENFLMPDKVLENYIKKYIRTQSIPEISFVWQGGEPMLAGINFYERAIRLQQKYAGEKKIFNVLQTNGTLLNEEWCAFLKENHFFVGLSLDGPEHIHNRYRRDLNDQPTFSRVLTGLKLLQAYGIEYNVLACVAKDTCQNPLETYQFFKKSGVKYIQFTPIVERLPEDHAKSLGLKNAMPAERTNVMTEWSVDAKEYGEFLITIFDEWVKQDVGNVFVMNFEWALTSWMGLESTVCIFAQQCGECAMIEHNGDIYSCDHYMYQEYHLGNILKDSPAYLMRSEQQIKFGNAKNHLSLECQMCDVRFACHGECPRHRFEKKGESYLCEAYYPYFRHIHPYMKAMTQLLANHQPVSDIMKLQEAPIVIVKNQPL